jgi:hypothetical protein
MPKLPKIKEFYHYIFFQITLKRFDPIFILGILDHFRSF